LIRLRKADILFDVLDERLLRPQDRRFDVKPLDLPAWRFDEVHDCYSGITFVKTAVCPAARQASTIRHFVFHWRLPTWRRFPNCSCETIRS
jgi:hypothetical protein